MMSFEKPAGSNARNGEAKVKPEGCTTVFIGNLSWSIGEVFMTTYLRIITQHSHWEEIGKIAHTKMEIECDVSRTVIQSATTVSAGAIDIIYCYY